MFDGERAETWLSALAEPRLPQVFNPWGQRNKLDLEHDGPAARILRLRAHFGIDNPRVLLVGEAPGYQGAKWTGIAYTSERLLYDGSIPRLEAQAQQRVSVRPIPFSEPSATIVWKTLFELGIAERTILWNAFPWHPYADDELSNRPPKKEELDTGIWFLEGLLSIFEGVMVVAVGKHAEWCMGKLAVKHVAVRHPSMGGASAFRSQLRSCLQGP